MTPREIWARRVAASSTREFVVFGSSTFLYQGGRFVFYLAAASAMAPADFASWAIVLAILVYAPSLLFGVTNGMSRELPILSGRQEETDADRTEDAAWFATIASVAVVLALCVVGVTVATTDLRSVVLLGLLAAGTIVYFTALSVLRSRLRFNAASIQQGTFGVVAIVAALVLGASASVDLAAVASYYGAAIALSVGVGLGLARPSSLKPDIQEVRRLARIGFPIMLAGLLFSLYVTSDRWIAIVLLGEETAGPYTFASLIAAAALVIPSVVSQQVYPRMGIARGQDATARQLRGMARGQGLLAAGLVLPITIGVSLFAWVGIPVLLPAYAAAASSVVVLSLGLLALSFFSGYGNYLNVVGGQWRYFGSQVVGLVTAVTLMVIGGTALGLIGIAIGMTSSHLIYGLVLRAAAMQTGIRPSPAMGASTELA